MFEWKEKPHPLYPEENQNVRKIHLYPPRECDSCSKVDHEVEWHEILKTESQSMWITPGTTFTVKTEMKKLCKRCHTLETNQTSMYGAFG